MAVGETKRPVKPGHSGQGTTGEEVTSEGRQGIHYLRCFSHAKNPERALSAAGRFRRLIGKMMFWFIFFKGIKVTVRKGMRGSSMSDYEAN